MGGGRRTEHGTLAHAPLSIGLRTIACRLTEGHIEQEEHASRASLIALRGIVHGGIVPLSGLGMCLLWFGGYDHPIDLFLIGLLLLGLVFTVEQHVYEASTLFPRRIAVRGHDLLVSTPLQVDVHSLLDVYFSDGHAHTLSPPFRHRCVVLRIRRRALKLQVGFTKDSANVWRQCLSENGAVLVPQQSRPVRFSLLTLVLSLTIVAAACGLGPLYGMHGAIVPLDAVVLCWIAASLCGSEGLFGRRIRRLTISESVVLLFICFILHGLAMPAVETGGHPRRLAPTAAPIVPHTPATPTDEVSGQNSPNNRPYDDTVPALAVGREGGTNWGGRID